MLNLPTLENERLVGAAYVECSFGLPYVRSIALYFFCFYRSHFLKNRYELAAESRGLSVRVKPAFFKNFALFIFRTSL